MSRLLIRYSAGSPLILHPMNPRQEIQAEELQALARTVWISLKAKARGLPEKELGH